MRADLAAATWRKSSRSNAEQACVEVARMSNVVGIRDSKRPEGGHLALTPAAFGDLIAWVRTGDVDL
ncbi:DUF397 domain-containing protein [Actinomadura graeca]|uniref:DUF397 domain-containing protein n=1 Tax=Actinomadura graeca TaxID=2750812 RepID=A0ABX8QM77_9ACTN|nr:DUF397 domain-containing protein [Actinomadura graeca]QXJ19638.1 DUF397 domain-containing protein [Actinomadura graeca]